MIYKFAKYSSVTVMLLELPSFNTLLQNCQYKRSLSNCDNMLVKLHHLHVLVIWLAVVIVLF